MNKRIIVAALTCALAGASGVALAGGDAAAGKAKAAMCSSCHAPDGNSMVPTFPKLAGQNERYLIKQMNDIKSGARSNGQSAAMKGVMHLVSDEEMQALAEYIATMAP